MIIIESNYDTTYEYVESPKPSEKSKNSVKYDTTSEKISTDPSLTHFSDEGKAYHDVGPNASSPPELPARITVGAQIHEQNQKCENVYHCADSEAETANDEVNCNKNQLTIAISNSLEVRILIVSSSGKILTLSLFKGAEQPKLADVFDTAGIYVPTTVRTTN